MDEMRKKKLASLFQKQMKAAEKDSLKLKEKYNLSFNPLKLQIPKITTQNVYSNEKYGE